MYFAKIKKKKVTLKKKLRVFRNVYESCQSDILVELVMKKVDLYKNPNRARNIRCTPAFVTKPGPATLGTDPEAPPPTPEGGAEKMGWVEGPQRGMPPPPQAREKGPAALSGQDLQGALASTLCGVPESGSVCLWPLRAP